MSQEILFLLFMTFELVAIMALYTFWIIPRVALKTNNLFEERMLDKTWDIPAMLEDYTATLVGSFDAHFFGFVDDDKKVHRGRIQKYYEGMAGKTAKAMSGDPAALAPLMLKELQGQPWYVQAIASRVMGPALERAADGLPVTPTEPPVASYSPGLTRK